MDESLWSEKTCSSLISDLPLWIIEHAWSNRMIDVLEVLGPPPWLEGDWGCLSLKDPCSIRVVAAEAWMVIQARDIKHFERVMEFLDITYTLLPQLVTSIKHMKIMFGLKTLVIMWMLWDDQNVASITDKIMRLFPDSLSQYHRSNRRHMELMQKTQQEFKSFALTLAKNTDMRKTYVRDLMEEQYGERYALKLEERLLHYLEELDKALPQPTRIDQILKQSLSVGEREELLQQLLTLNVTSLSTALKRLLRCAMTNHFSCGITEKCGQEKEAEADRPVIEPYCVTFKPSQEMAEEERVSQTCSQGSCLKRQKQPSLLQKGSEKTYLNGNVMMLKQKPDPRSEISQSDMDTCVVKEQDPQRAEPGLTAEQKEAKKVTTEHLCSRHGKKMKSILLECSEELKGQERQAPLAQSQCTPPSPLTPLLHSTPQSLMHSSASLLTNSSATNISLDSSSTNLSGAEFQQVTSSQPSLDQHVILSPTSPVQQNSSSVHQEAFSPVISLQPHLSQMSLALPNLSSFSGNRNTLASASTTHDIALSPTASSLVQQESSTPVFSVYQKRSFVDQQPCSSLNSLSLASPTSSHNSEQVPSIISQNLDSVSNSNSALGGKLKLSLETQGFLLLCKWLQPRVLLCRLSQQQCPVTTCPAEVSGLMSEEEEVDEEGKENESFDINLLYSDSESDPQDSDDSDYVPSKRLKV